MSAARPLPPHELFVEEVNRIRLDTNAENYEQPQQQERIAAAVREYVVAAGIANCRYYAPLPQLTLMGAEPWITVVWVVGCPDSVLGPDGEPHKRLLSYQYAVPSSQGAIRIEASMLFPEYDDAADLAAALSLGRQSRESAR